MASISLFAPEDARGNVQDDSADVDAIMRSLVQLMLLFAQALKLNELGGNLFKPSLETVMGSIRRLLYS